MNLLYVNCCMRPAQISRTSALCQEFITAYKEIHPEHTIQTIVLKDEDLKSFTYERTLERDKLMAAANWDDAIFTYAKRFAEADKIIIGSPYWDLSFPALLKIYFENIFVTDLTYRYGESGVIGLCKASKLIYITSSGGFIGDNDFGSDYIQGICRMFGIADFESFKAEGLDIQEQNIQDILRKATEDIRAIAKIW